LKHYSSWEIISENITISSSKIRKQYSFDRTEQKLKMARIRYIMEDINNGAE
jgi:hypothetical protein